MWIEDDIIVLGIRGAMEVRDIMQFIDMSEEMYARYGYVLCLGDGQHTTGLTADARKAHAERLKHVLRPSHAAIYHVNAVARMMTKLSQRGIELLTGKVYPVSFHKDEAEARAELARRRAILSGARPPA